MAKMMWDFIRVDSVGLTKDDEYRLWAVMLDGMKPRPVPELYRYEEYYIFGKMTCMIIARPKDEKEMDIVRLIYKCDNMYDIHKLHNVREYRHKLNLIYQQAK